MVRPFGALAISLASASRASSIEIAWPWNEARAARRSSAPSSSRTLVLMCAARYSATSSGRLTSFRLGLALEDGDARLQVGRLDLGDEAPGEAAAQPVLHAGQLGGQLVRRQDDLLVRVVERVEGVKELVLRAVLVRQELDVVDEQDVRRGPVARAEVLHRGARRPADRTDEVGHELLAGDEADRPLGVLAMNLVTDGLQEVGLAQADAAVDEQRVPA